MKMKTTMMVLAALCAAPFAHASVLISGVNDTDVNIPDNDSISGASSGIYISPSLETLPDNPSVVDLSVTFTITGLGGNAWAGDYTLTLQHVSDDGLSSQSLTLFSSLLGGTASNNGFDNVTLDSSGSSDISMGASGSSTTAITGTYGGVDFASTFGGVDPTGDWILYITDNSADFTGQLTGWSLSMEVVPEPVNVALGIFSGLMGGVVLWRHWSKSRRQKVRIGF